MFINLKCMRINVENQAMQYIIGTSFFVFCLFNVRYRVVYRVVDPRNKETVYGWSCGHFSLP